MEQKNFVESIDTLIKFLNLYQAKINPVLIAIDGRPLSGKSTLADNLAEKLRAQTIHLDEFFIPLKDWPVDREPRFPFFYFRYNEFLNGIQLLSNKKEFKYFTYDWELNDISKRPKIIFPNGIIIIEGTSIFNQKIINYYYKKIWILSDSKNELEALNNREGKKNLELWENIYLPSINIYYETKPWRNADILFAGRGAENESLIKKDMLNFLNQSKSSS